MVQGPLSISDSKNPSYNCIQLLRTRLSFQTGKSKNERVKNHEETAVKATGQMNGTH